MQIEIERKFLVISDTWKAFAEAPETLRQGYFTKDLDEWVMRIRIINNQKSLITLKSRINKLSNHEFEFDIPIEEAEQIWPILNFKLKKKRYRINLSPGEWVVDCFEGENFPLTIAEVELPSIETIIKKPSWAGQEITEIPSLSNAALAKLPFSQWDQKEKRKIKFH